MKIKKAISQLFRSFTSNTPLHIAPWLPLIMAITIVALLKFYSHLSELKYTPLPTRVTEGLSALKPEPAFSGLILQKTAWSLAAATLCFIAIASNVIIYLQLHLRIRALPNKSTYKILVYAASIIGLGAAIYMLIFPNPILPKFAQQLLDLIASQELRSNLYSLNALSFITSWNFCILFGSCVAIMRDEVTSLSNIKARISALDDALLLCAAFMISGVLEIHSLFQLPAGITKSLAPLAREQAESICISISMSAGIVYSLMLLSAYMPAALLLRSRACRRINLDYPELTAEKQRLILEDHGLTSSLWEHGKRFITIIGPIITAGPITSALGDLFSN
jgi:hypothetical protein